MENLISDPRFALYQDRLANRDELEPMIYARMKDDSSEYWLERLSEFDVPNAPILGIGEALEQDHIAQHGLIETVNHPVAGDMRIVRGPILFDGQGPSPATAPALLGEHSHRILTDDLGYSDDEVKEMVQNGVISCPD